MGLLNVLDFFEELEKNKEKKYVEVEYQLYSWGEIYPPFYGDRKHSIEARHILRDFPFKLFSSSNPSVKLPQKLCLIFKAPDEQTQYTDEVAKEFAAFLSLVTRRRVFPGKHTRYNDLPIEYEIELYPRFHVQERQRIKEIKPEEFNQLLKNLQAMDRRIANAFILALRVYHTAIEMMYRDPEFSYLFLVTCLEAISSAVHKDYQPEDKWAFLDSRVPGWREPLDTLEENKREQLKDVLLKQERYHFQKFWKFVVENLPEHFWDETEDDAKPDGYYTIFNGEGKETTERLNITIADDEKIERDNLKQVLRAIYNVRSSLVHDGIQLPVKIVVGHYPLIPIEVIGEEMKKIPPLLTFERLVSYAMVEFLRRQRGEV